MRSFGTFRAALRAARGLPCAGFAASLLLTSALIKPGYAVAAVYPIVINNPPDRVMMDLAIPANAPIQGMWSRVVSWPLVGLHLSVLPTGQVLSYGATGVNGGTQDGRLVDVWDPMDGLTSAAHLMLANAAAVDSFCGTSALQSDGTELLTGGSSYVDNDSSQAGSVFGPTNLAIAALAYQSNAPRWYATMTTLQDGRQLISGGGVPYDTNAYADPTTNSLNNAVSMTPEVFTKGSGWTSLFGANSRTAFGPDDNRWWYPRQWVAPNGKVFGISANQMWYLDPAGNGTVTSLGAFKGSYSETALPNIGPTSTAVMYRPGLVLQVGGNGRNNGDPTTSSSTATVFDVRSGGAPIVRDVAAMSNTRQWGNSLILPNGKVLVTGGTTYADQAGTNAVYAAEIWDPATEKWTTGASAAIYRGYHSATTLLPDGAVLSSGGGVPGPVTNTNAEIYYPPYLFQAAPYGGAATLAPRPTLISMSANALTYGSRLNVELSSTAPIANVALIRLGITTHSFNSAEVYVNPTFTQVSNTLTISLPTSSAIAPPGYYQVVASNAQGVPSRGAIISLGAGFAPPATPPSIVAPATAPFRSANAKAIKVAAGLDGSSVYIDANNVPWKQAVANAPWIQLPGQIKDVAIVNWNSIWAIGMDDQVYHFTGSGNWARSGSDASTIAASADGTIIVTNLYTKSIWLKPTDDAQDNWGLVPGQAKRLAINSRNVMWMVGLDDNVYHWTAGRTWTQVGFAAQAISILFNGVVGVINNQDGSIWIKNDQNNDSSLDYTNNAGKGNEFAFRNTGAIWLIDAAGNLLTSQ